MLYLSTVKHRLLIKELTGVESQLMRSLGILMMFKNTLRAEVFSIFLDRASKIEETTALRVGIKMKASKALVIEIGLISIYLNQ